MFRDPPPPLGFCLDKNGLVRISGRRMLEAKVLAGLKGARVRIRSNIKELDYAVARKQLECGTNRAHENSTMEARRRSSI